MEDVNKEREQYNKHLEELKEKYCNKYFKVITKDLGNNAYIPEKHELVYITDIFQYFSESDAPDICEYMNALWQGIDDEYVNRKELEENLKNKEYIIAFQEKLCKKYNVQISHKDERIDFSGYSFQNISNLGESGGTFKSLNARIIECKNLIEITKEDFIENFEFVKGKAKNIFNKI